jgi:hypothetical protein
MSKLFEISRQGFNAIFNECMNNTIYFFADGSTSVGNIPLMHIRNQVTGEEIGFNDEDKAFNCFYNTTDPIRITDITGNIYLDQEV